MHYGKLAYESNPNNDNKLTYAIILYDSQKYADATLLFQELLKEEPSDEVRIYLADLYYFKRHLYEAYKLYEQITEDEYMDGKQRMMEEIKKYLPNAPRMKNFRIDSRIIEMSEEKCYLPILDMAAPEEQILNGKVYYLDPIRRKPILKTPEEEIRQKTIQYLMRHLNIPKENILVEESLSHTDKSLKERIDIMVYIAKNGVKRNLLIIECKELKSTVVGEPIEQILKYNFHYESKYLMITNGNDSLIYSSNDLKNKFISLSELPDFMDMCTGVVDISAIEPIEHWVRPDRVSLETEEYLDNGLYNGTIGEDSIKDIGVLALNLHYCFVDSSEKLKIPLKGLSCNVTNDYGITYRKSGNPSGGKFDLNFRWLEVIDRNGNTNNIYFAIAGFAKTINDPKYGNSKGTSNIYVCVEHKGKAVNMLIVCLDRHAKQNGNLITITHDGRRSRKNSQSTLDYVGKYCPKLLRNGAVYLGVLDNSKNFSLTGDMEQEFLIRLIDYTLLRYELWLKDRENK